MRCDADHWKIGAEPVLAEPTDNYVDYCLWPYEPLTNTEGKWRSSNLLRHSFDHAGIGHEIFELCATLQDTLGAGRIIWGIKMAEGQLFWEFYFYDYGRMERQVSVSQLLKLLSPWVKCELAMDESRPYFMFSIEFNQSWNEPAGRILNDLSVYIGNPSSQVSSGISYTLSNGGLAFDNLYYFFATEEHHEEILGKVLCSAHIDLTTIDPSDLLWPELVDCGVTVVANKRFNDGLYFSRIKVQQLVSALRRLQFPAELVEHIDGHAHLLDHLYFDVGFDYKMVDGQVQLLKGAYYGYF